MKNAITDTFNNSFIHQFNNRLLFSSVKDFSLKLFLFVCFRLKVLAGCFNSAFDF